MRRGAIRCAVFVALVAIASVRGGGSPGPVTANGVQASATDAPALANRSAESTVAMSRGSADPVAVKPIVHDGQTFVLANSTSTKSVDTDEYTTGGEKLGEWTQLVTVQRLTLEKPTSAEAFVV